MIRSACELHLNVYVCMYVPGTGTWWCTTTSATFWNSPRKTTAIPEVHRYTLACVVRLQCVCAYIHTFHSVVLVDGSGYDGVALRQSRSNLGYNNATSGIMRGTNILFAGGDGDGIGDPYNRTTFSARSQVKVFFALLMVL